MEDADGGLEKMHVFIGRHRVRGHCAEGEVDGQLCFRLRDVNKIKWRGVAAVFTSIPRMKVRHM